MSPRVQAFFDSETHSVSYLVSDPATQRAAVIDPVLDYDHRSGEVRTVSTDRIIDAARDAGLTIVWILETHVHADHLSGALHLTKRSRAQIAIGEHIRAVQETFCPVFNLDVDSDDGCEFDLLLRDGQRLALGSLQIEVIHTPGHTPACVSYLIGDAVFVGDTLFMPDSGTARTDFPGGSARTLYQSIQRLLALPAETRVFVCHDYKAPGRDDFAWETTIATQRQLNIHARTGISEEEYTAMREARDATLSPPALLLPSIQVNMRAGRLLKPEANGVSYLKIPVSFK